MEDDSITAEIAADASVPDAWFVYIVECADGSLYAGVLLGVIDTLGRYYLPALGAFVIYLAVLALLLARPQGLVAKTA